jgi:hypothetical protein
MRHLGGPHRINILKNLELIQFLEKLAVGRDTAEEEKAGKRIDAKLKAAAGTGERLPLKDARRIMREEFGRLSAVPFATGDVEEREFFKNMNRIANAQRFPADVNVLVENYTRTKISNLGIRVQCSVCDQRSWHSIRSDIQCPVCLGQFPLPTHDPRNEIKWSYKSLGPLALPKQGFGAYSVLLTVHFLATCLHPSVTPVLSFRGTRKDCWSCYLLINDQGSF